VRRKTVSMVLIEKLGFREALRVQVTCTLWAVFEAVEGHAPAKAEFHEAFGYDDATVYRRLQSWRDAFPDGPTLPEFAAQIAATRGAGVTARVVGGMEIA
jgi:hypothetical protein